MQKNNPYTNNKNLEMTDDITVVDGIKIDNSNPEFIQALHILENPENKVIYLTGKAGTGKTTFLKYFRTTTKRNMVVLAPTGVAAINAGGQTIHSFFKIPFGPFKPNDKRLRTSAASDKENSTIYDHFIYPQETLDLIKELDLLVIDEASMVRCDVIDVIDRLLRVFRKREKHPFGGIQVLLIGDALQLSPIVKAHEWDILKHFYDSCFFFDSIVLKQNKPICIELKKNYRQNDEAFIGLLNRIRINATTPADLELLNSKFDPYFSPADDENCIILSTHNINVENINQRKLSELSTKLFVYEGVIEGTYPDGHLPTEHTLFLKEGAQIMLVVNDIPNFYNGSIGKIKKLYESKIIVELSDGRIIGVEKHTWKNARYIWNYQKKKIEEEIVGCFIQFPIRLAWAITVHKSQGLTFNRVIADLGKSFANGQVYVALSRCSNFEGLILKTPINKSTIKADQYIIDYFSAPNQ